MARSEHFLIILNALAGLAFTLVGVGRPLLVLRLDLVLAVDPAAQVEQVTPLRTEGEVRVLR